MCGIVGFCGRGDAAILERMMRRLAHRGPDGRGTFVQPEQGVFLGHLRLAIVDLAGGAQPMWNEDGSVGVIFNGEIYNHDDLRRELLARGHRFATDHSDTEVLVHGYEEWREGLLPRLNGMFAFAIVDLRRRELCLARDRFGEKPLYFTRQNGVFAFASEASAFREHPSLQLAPDEVSVQKFLACGFVVSPRSLYRDVWKLPPATSLVVPFAGGEGSPVNYWRFRVEPDHGTPRHEEEVVEEFSALFGQAVRRRLLSDVPLGVFLSGGLDSSATVLAALRGAAGARLKTFTIGFDEPSYDEREPAAAVAAQCGTDHQVQVLTLREAEALLDNVLARLDEPIADPSILPTFLLSRFTRQQVTVALSGDGGDELLAGYDPFRALGLAQALDRFVPRGLWRVLRAGAELLPRSDRNMSLDFKVRRTLGGIVRPVEQWNPAWLGPVSPEEIAALFEEPLPAEELYAEPIALWRSRPDLSVEERTLEFYTRFYLTENILFKVDRAGMLNSLESRAVFLDNDLVDFCRRLPFEWKYRSDETKVVLRRALAREMPAIARRPKKGFGVPVAKWLRALPPERFAAVRWPGWRSRVAAEMITRHRNGTRDHRGLLWGMLAMQPVLS